MSNADIRGQFIWHELMTTDTDAAAAFYPKVLPWKTQASGQPGYTLWYAGRTQAGGLMSLPAQSAAAGSAPHWLVYIGTPSVDSTVAAVQQLGGKVLKSPADIPGIGRFAVVSDPQGAGFALYTPASGAGDGAQPPAAGAYSWHELATSDPQAALDFYTELFGWEKGRAHDMGGEAGIYQMISHGGRDVGGIYRTQQASTAPSWLTYVQVADIDRAVSAAGSGGGRVLNGPHQVPGGGWIAQLEDPQGGRFAVVESEPQPISEPRAESAAGRTRPRAVTSGAGTAGKSAGGAAGKPARKTAGKAARQSPGGAARKRAGKAARKPASRAAGGVVRKAGAKKTGAKKAKKSGHTRRTSAGKTATRGSAAARRGSAIAKRSGRAGARKSARSAPAKRRSGVRAKGPAKGRARGQPGGRNRTRRTGR